MDPGIIVPGGIGDDETTSITIRPSAPAANFASPKSKIFTCPSRVVNTFSGFRSR